MSTAIATEIACITTTDGVVRACPIEQLGTLGNKFVMWARSANPILFPLTLVSKFERKII